jgi:hypothetical protein
MGSDHKPGKAISRFIPIPRVIDLADVVFGIFRAEVRIIDPVKKAVVSRMLLESVVSTEPGELLADKLKEMTLPKTVGDCKTFAIL